MTYRRRTILLDCQPLLSASIMDRAIQLEKKFTNESAPTENTIEIQSLQIIGMLYPKIMLCLTEEVKTSSNAGHQQKNPRIIVVGLFVLSAD
jgi:hypothetical protein